MRLSLFIVALAVFSMTAAAQDEVKPKKTPRRFGFDVDETTFPQKTPAEAMKSIGTALDRKRLDYMLAHMVDPKYVDYWVDRYKTVFAMGSDEAKGLLAFDRLVRETNLYYQDDPVLLRELRVFARDAEWTEDDGVAFGVVKTIAARKVYLRKIGDRWFLDNRQ